MCVLQLLGEDVCVAIAPPCGWPIHMLSSFRPDAGRSRDLRRWHLTLSSVNGGGISAPRPVAAVGPVSKVLSSLVGHHT